MDENELIGVAVVHVRAYGPAAALVFGYIAQSIDAETGVWRTTNALDEISAQTGLGPLASQRALAALRARGDVVSVDGGMRLVDSDRPVS